MTPRPPTFDASFFTKNARVDVIKVSALCDLCDAEAAGEGCPRCGGAYCKAHAAEVERVRCCSACEYEYQRAIDKRPRISKEFLYAPAGAVTGTTLAAMYMLSAPALTFVAFMVYAGFVVSLLVSDRARWKDRAAFLMTKPGKRAPKPVRREDVCVLLSNRPPANVDSEATTQTSIKPPAQESEPARPIRAKHDCSLEKTLEIALESEIENAPPSSTAA